MLCRSLGLPDANRIAGTALRLLPGYHGKAHVGWVQRSETQQHSSVLTTSHRCTKRPLQAGDKEGSNAVPAMPCSSLRLPNPNRIAGTALRSLPAY
ncbi:MAG: hypothetical protein Fues2KO_25060 [Fuerstiella sp.]